MKNKIIILSGILCVFCIYVGPTLMIKNNQLFISDSIQIFDMLDMPKPIIEPANIVLIRYAAKANNLYVDHEFEPFVIVPLDNTEFFDELKRLQEFNIISEAFKTSLVNQKDTIVKMMGGGSVYLYDVKVQHSIYKMYQIVTQNKFIYISLPKEDIAYSDEKKKSLLDSYIKYLGLDYIKEWTYKNNSLFSSKINGAVRFEEQKNCILLQLIEHY